MKEKGVRIRISRGLFWRMAGLLLFLQVLGLAAAGAALYFIADQDLAADFFSAHKSITSVWEVLLPAILIAAVAAFVVIGGVSVLILRLYGRKFIEPIRRVEDVLHRIARGELSSAPLPGVRRDPWGLDNSSEVVLNSLRERVEDIRQITRDLHQSVMTLRYKATESDGLTLKELRTISLRLDALCKKMLNAVKWFEA